MPGSLLLPVEFGNASALNTQGTGWIVGFSDWCQAAPHHLRHVPDGQLVEGPCVKWFSHRAGDPNGQAKPISTGRTLSILISPDSTFRLDFCAHPAFAADDTLTHVLRRMGDYVVWGPGVFHRAFGIEAATVLTVRWAETQA